MTKEELSKLFEKLCDTLEHSYYGAPPEFFDELDIYLKAGGNIQANDKNLLHLAKIWNHSAVAERLTQQKVFNSPSLPPLCPKMLALTTSARTQSEQQEPISNRNLQIKGKSPRFHL